MSYQIDAEAPLGESIRRIACEEIQAAIAVSKRARSVKGSPVHQTRKHLKKARAALGLLATEVSPDRFRSEDRRLRNVGRLISDIRDAEVRLQTVKQLRKDSNLPRSQSFVETEELLAFELDSFLAAFAGWQDEAVSTLRRAQAAIAQWHLHKLTRKQVCRMVRATYRSGQRALKRAQKKGSPKRFHELRRRAKELWYQLRLLRPLQPAVLGELSRDLKTLGEHLGHAHDLCFVAERLQFIARGSARKRGRRALEAVIDTREEDLLSTACALGERFYCIKSKEFGARIADYFDEFGQTKLRKAHQVTAEIRGNTFSPRSSL